MRELREIGYALTQSVGFKHAESVIAFLETTIGNVRRIQLEPIGEKTRIHTEHGIWTAWSKVIAGKLMVYCEAPEGVVQDRTFSLDTKEVHEHGYIPPDCGHKTPAHRIDFDDGRLPPTEPLE